jgi:hypothetical protein
MPSMATISTISTTSTTRRTPGVPTPPAMSTTATILETSAPPTPPNFPTAPTILARRARWTTLAAAVALAGCGSSRPAEPPPPAPFATPAAEVAERGRAFGRLHEAYGHSALGDRRFRHEELWRALAPVVDSSAALSRELLGRSVEGREIWSVRYGNGPVRVLLWSQMHGDESTSTRALLDLFHMLATQPDHLVSRRLAEALTIEAIPMLNPDGAHRFTRRNAQGIDVNRDARALQTPEGRILREAQRRFMPDFGFNLHDQNVRTRVGREGRTAAMALLAPAFDEARSDNAVRDRAMLVAAVMRDAMEPYVGGHITQYDDTYAERAFGDSMQRWGTSTTLLETGGWRNDPEKSFLRKVSFVAIVAALDAIATGAWEGADVERYTALPFNGPSAADLLVRGGSLVPPGGAPFVADLVVNYAEPLQRLDGTIADVGDMEGVVVARDTLDVEGLFVHLGGESINAGRGGVPVIGIGLPARFIVRRDLRPGSAPVWWMDGGAPRDSPPATGASPYRSP